MTPDDEIRAAAQRAQPPQIDPSRSHDPSNNLKRSDPFQFGSRYLEKGDDVFEFNAWDHVEPDEDFKAYAECQYEKQRAAPVTDFDKNRFNQDPAKWWNLFYKNNTENFFKDRKWLRQEFPVLEEVTQKDAGPQVVLEVGAGAGNTAFPLIRNNENEHLKVHACDFSKYAVKVMRESEHYDEKYMVADVWDVAAEPDENGDYLPPGLTEGSVDVVILIFIFSALNPVQWNRALHNIYRVLKPGGRVLFRDYGRGDLAQVRFKKGRYMDENFYVRGDGTRVYFFDKDELLQMWGRWTLEKGLQVDTESTLETLPAEPNAPFEVVHMGIDRRLLVNRSSKLKMYRCWMQGHFRKRDVAAAATAETGQ
ncbi:tRNA(Thr) (cytosine(32)-N(3))-methyltransferase [Penicillium cinerascens]|uniref:tRNA N(3)-methylcytidine methyltransferase n=1 Tax=Penicillium cinerascens TaxID=70096 RepID=A0A9W9MIW1_9EURO|nr:tRNA(Thr) (cytosine(32)-N(3))-methyltransferase [Penicillium cinerascens]KAJ5202089.1 tRNA(Thr) (cytosine(32)-N(3))-methyltransferase [Penicillium cinerascens]